MYVCGYFYWNSICLQLCWTSFVNNADAGGQELRRCCRGQAPGWHHACMRRCAPLGLVWAEANRSYCIPPPSRRAPAMGTSPPPSSPSTRLGLFFCPLLTSAETRCRVGILVQLHKGLKEAQLRDSVLLHLSCLLSVGKQGTWHKKINEDGAWWRQLISQLFSSTDWLVTKLQSKKSSHTDTHQSDWCTPAAECRSIWKHLSTIYLI